MFFSGDYQSSVNEDGTGTGVNTLTFSASRGDLGATLTCEVHNIAMDEPSRSSVTLDVNGKIALNMNIIWRPPSLSELTPMQ